MLDLTATGMQGGLIALGAEFFVLQFSGNRLFVDPGLVILHFALFAGEVDIGVLSAWHVKYGY